MVFSILKNLFIQNKAQDHDYAELFTFNSDKEPLNYILMDKNKVSTNFSIIHKELPNYCYSSYKNHRTPKLIVICWDATLSSNHCFEILKTKKRSTCFNIDNLGQIYQFVDTNNVSWHTGPTSIDKKLLSNKGCKLPKSISWNEMAIGIDISNAYYLNYNNWYIKNIGKARPVINSFCQKQLLKNHLGYYSEQIESLTNLIAFLCHLYDIPLETPKSTSWLPECANGSFQGVVCHYHLTPNEIDCAGLDLQSIIKRIKDENL